MTLHNITYVTSQGREILRNSHISKCTNSIYIYHRLCDNHKLKFTSENQTVIERSGQTQQEI